LKSPALQSKISISLDDCWSSGSNANRTASFSTDQFLLIRLDHEILSLRLFVVADLPEKCLAIERKRRSLQFLRV
jgi:hypothetical protein